MASSHQKLFRSGSHLQQTSGFFRLSAELRNLIYELVIETHAELWVTASKHYRTDYGSPVPIAAPPAISRVCRMIRADTLPMFFGNAIFSITLMRESNVARAKTWIAAMGDDAIKCIRTFRLHGPRHQLERTYYGVPSIRIRTERRQDGSVKAVDCWDEVSSIVTAGAEAIEKLEACVNENSAGRLPLSQSTEVEALLETFASLLSFRQEMPEEPRQAIRTNVTYSQVRGTGMTREEFL